jgi:hypothetical protein
LHLSGHCHITAVKQGVTPTMVNSWATTIMLTWLQKMQYSLLDSCRMLCQLWQQV